MEYIFPILLTTLSYLFGVYFAHQGLRNEIERPLIYSSGILLFVLTILFGIVPFAAALFLGFTNVGLGFSLALLVVRFLILPSLFNDWFGAFLSKKGL